MHFHEWLLTPMAYVEMALLLFLSVFVSVLVRESIRPKREITRLAAMPLADLPETPKEAQ